MAFYDTHILPHLINLGMRSKRAARRREKVIPAARGRVLELGIGSGLNLPFYTPEVTAVVGIDPSPRLLAMARRAARDTPFDIELVDGSAEKMPFDDRSFDSVVTTWTLCSIPDPAAALGEARRVLKPDGELIFTEHGASPDRRVAAWQDRLNPLWRCCAGGCNLNRRIDVLIGEAGFAMRQLDTGYLVDGPRFVTFHYEGRAVSA